MRNYIDLTTIYSEDTFGDYKLFPITESTELSEEIKNFYSISNEYDNFSEIYLTKEDVTIMWCTKFVMATSKNFLDTSYGDILIIGLGLGMVIYPLLDDPTVTSIKIIEKDQSLIENIGSKILTHDVSSKVTILSGDGYTYFSEINSEEKYDTIYLDFWSNLNTNVLEELTTVKENYRPFLKNENSILMSWCEDIKDLLYKSYNP